MRNPARGGLRVARSVALAAVVVALSAAAHVMGGGGVPPGLALALVPVVALPAAVLTRRRLGVVGVSALLGAGQVVLHRVFEAAHAGTGLAAMDPDLPCHPGAGALLVPEVALGGGGALGTGGAGGAGGLARATDPAMLVAHLVATVALVAVVLLGDRLLYAVRRVCRPIPRAGSVVLVSRRPLPPAAVIRPLVGRPGVSAPFLRGPPRPLGA